MEIHDYLMAAVDVIIELGRAGIPRNAYSRTGLSESLAPLGSLTPLKVGRGELFRS